MPAESQPTESATTRQRHDLFLISFLILFLELACIRWFPAHVLYLTFFTNLVLLACFLGMSLGCLAARTPRDWLAWTPLLLMAALLAGFLMDRSYGMLSRHLAVGDPDAPELVFFGTEVALDRGLLRVPVELISGLFFVLITLVMIGPGQELGRTFNQFPNRVLAYTINIAGSMAGIVVLAGMSWLQLGPIWWFLVIVACLGYFLYRRPAPVRPWVNGAALAVVLAIGLLSSLPLYRGTELAWSPYYRIQYLPAQRDLVVNLISHQRMIGGDQPDATGRHPPAYALPYLLRQHAGLKELDEVMIVGAGSGNDVSRALQWGAKHVDAVEIDAAIFELGRQRHPDRPYAAGRPIARNIDDGRNFIRSTERHYDLIVFAVVDSLVLHSGYSSIRLESFLYTRECFADARRRLKPDGLLCIYSMFRQGWIVDRLRQGLFEAFGEEPLVLTFPYRPSLSADDPAPGVSLLLAGSASALAPLRTAFERQPEYWLDCRAPFTPACPNGFETPDAQQRSELLASGSADLPWTQVGMTRMLPPASPLHSATDDWPFLYLRNPMIPWLSIRGVLLMAGIAALLLWCFVPPKSAHLGGSGAVAMFFLGAGFMLIETKAVVHLALLFGSTWMVNSLVFFAILLMILGANLFVLRFGPIRLWPYYVGLFLSLGLNLAIPLESFLGVSRWLQVGCSSLLAFAPILFAGVIFAMLFGRTAEPDRAFGFNIAGAMAGGLTENSSMLLGFHYLVVVAMVYYAMSLLGRGSRTPPEGRAEELELSSSTAG